MFHITNKSKIAQSAHMHIECNVNAKKKKKIISNIRVLNIEIWTRYDEWILFQFFFLADNIRFVFDKFSYIPSCYIRMIGYALNGFYWQRCIYHRILLITKSPTEFRLHLNVRKKKKSADKMLLWQIGYTRK